MAPQLWTPRPTGSKLEVTPRAEESHMFPMGLVILIACIVTVVLAFVLLIDARSDR